jgi:hypothetical protein
MEFTASDVHTVLASFAGVMLAEVVVKPIAIRIGRTLLRQLDGAVGDLLPNWLWDTSERASDK